MLIEKVGDLQCPVIAHDEIGWYKQFTDNRNTIDGWLEVEVQDVLFNAAVLCKNPIIEIGSFKGLSAVHLAAGTKLSENPHKVIAIDPGEEPGGGGTNCEEEYAPIFLANLEKCGVRDSVDFIRKTSQDAIEDMEEYFKTHELAELLFIDGDHTYEGVSHDYHNYNQFVKKGGLIVVHDSGFEGPAKLLEELKGNSRVAEVLTVCSATLLGVN